MESISYRTMIAIEKQQQQKKILFVLCDFGLILKLSFLEIVCNDVSDILKYMFLLLESGFKIDLIRI